MSRGVKRQESPKPKPQSLSVFSRLWKTLCPTEWKNRHEISQEANLWRESMNTWLECLVSIGIVEVKNIKGTKYFRLNYVKKTPEDYE